MTEQTYRGACHCGAVTFEAPLDLEKTMQCNCSRCQKVGWIMAFAHASVVKTEGATKEYLFNKRVIRHQFCAECGVEPFAFAASPDGTPMVAINVNCLDGVDPRTLSPKPVDGRSR
jgi:hypothetical protein